MLPDAAGGIVWSVDAGGIVLPVDPDGMELPLEPAGGIELLSGVVGALGVVGAVAGGWSVVAGGAGVLGCIEASGVAGGWAVVSCATAAVPIANEARMISLLFTATSFEGSNVEWARGRGPLLRVCERA